MDIRERIKVGIECKHYVTEYNVNRWGGHYMNGKKLVIGDQIWYTLIYKNRVKCEMDFLVININDLNDYEIDENDLNEYHKKCTVPVLKLKK